MDWVDIKTKGLPQLSKVDEWVLSTHPWMNDSVLVYGFDHINFTPRYQVMYIGDVTRATQNVDDKYVVDGIILSHWIKLERPI